VLYNEAFYLLQEDQLQTIPRQRQTESGRTPKPLSNPGATAVQVILATRRISRIKATKSETVTVVPRRCSKRQTTVSYGVTCRCALRIACFVPRRSGVAGRTAQPHPKWLRFLLYVTRLQISRLRKLLPSLRSRKRSRRQCCPIRKALISV
jgi:hypothetical protein